MSNLKIGLGETVITPEEPVRMRGFARSQMSTGVHDHLHARSLLIEDPHGSTTILQSISLCGLTEEYAHAMRAGVTEQTGILGERIFISCTHTHAGPNVGGSHDTFNKEEVAASIANPAYRQFLVDQCIASAVAAWQTRALGSLS